jgi:hypothetical protein
VALTFISVHWYIHLTIRPSRPAKAGGLTQTLAADIDSCGGSNLCKKAMNKYVASIAVLLLCETSQAESFVVNQRYESIAEVLQRELPRVSCDRMFEAERVSNGMVYRFYLQFDKTWADEVIVALAGNGSQSSNVNVEARRTSGGLLFSSSDLLLSETEEWSHRMRRLLSESPRVFSEAEVGLEYGCLNRTRKPSGSR